MSADDRAEAMYRAVVKAKGAELNESERTQLVAAIIYAEAESAPARIKSLEAEVERQRGIKLRIAARLVWAKDLLETIRSDGYEHRQEAAILMHHVQHCDEEEDDNGMCMCGRAIAEALGMKHREIAALRAEVKQLEWVADAIRRWPNNKRLANEIQRLEGLIGRLVSDIGEVLPRELADRITARIRAATVKKGGGDGP